MVYTAKNGGSMCYMETFVINGVKADEEDFVEKGDTGHGSAEGGCVDMKAKPIPPTLEVLLKYIIDLQEYQTIAEDVAEQLSFGECGWCI